MNSAAPQTLPVDLDAAFAAASAQGEHQLVRFQAQAAFARALAKALNREGEWLPLVAKADAIMASALGGGPAALAAALAQAEAAMGAMATEAKTFTLHCAGHAHIDMNWLWGWQETVAVTVDTFSTVLALMDEFPDFHFTQSQASVYAIIEEHNPAMLERIRARVKEGRWEVAASHWVEGDRNMAGGEALARHLLYTRAYLQRIFDLKPEDVPVDWSPDTFGHAHTIPGIDAAGGVKYYYCCRPGPIENIPPVFWWQGADGAKVLVNKEFNWYNGTPVPSRATNTLDYFAKTGLRDHLMVYGVGDHGGGPTRRDLRKIIDMNAWPIFPNFKFASATTFFRKIDALAAKNQVTFPTLNRELNYEFSGCYTSQSAIKKANRANEIIASEAETAALIASRTLGTAYPTAKFEKIWQDVLFTHFHDILPGSGVRQTRDYCLAQHQVIVAKAGQIRTQSLRALAAAIDTGFSPVAIPAQYPVAELDSIALGGGAGREPGLSTLGVVGDGPRGFVVFNPVDAARNATEIVTIWDADIGPRPQALRDRSFVAHFPDGRIVQTTRVGNGDYWGHQYVELAVPVAVGPLGWSAVVIAEGKAPTPAKALVTHKRTLESHFAHIPNSGMEIVNEHIKVVFDRTSGGIVSLVDLASGVDVAAGKPLGVLEYVLERPVGMSAWILGDATERKPFTCTHMDVSHDGPWMQAVKATMVHGTSKFTVEFIVRAGQAFVEMSINGSWLEIGSGTVGIPRLSVRFPFGLQAVVPRYETPAGSITRSEPAGREVPALRWAAFDGSIGGKAAGCAVLNDGKHGHSLDGSTVQVNLIRSSYDPDPFPEVGNHAIRLALAPWAGTREAGALTKMAAAFNQPNQVVGTGIHKGTLPATVAAGIASDRDDVIVTQVKGSEAGGAVVVRVLNTASEAVTVTLTVAEAIFGKVQKAAGVDLLERADAARSVTAAGQKVTVKLAGKAMGSVLVTCG